MRFVGILTTIFLTNKSRFFNVSEFMGAITDFLKKNPILIGILAILCYFIPFLIMGEDSYILIHDNLDSAISRIKIIFDNDAAFSPDKILPVMDGLARSKFASMMNVKTWLFWAVPSFWAYLLNAAIVKTIAFLGMFLLLKNHIINNRNIILTLLVSLAFAFIPFYTDYDLSSAGIPLLLFAFFNLRKKQKLVVSYLLIFFYPLYSSLVLSGLFICFYLFVWGCYLLKKERKEAIPFVSGFLLLCFLYVVTNYNLFQGFILPSDYVSHRSEFQIQSSFTEILREWIAVIMRSQYHAGGFYAILIILCFIVSLILHRSREKLIFCGIAVSVILFIFIGKILPFIFPNIPLMKEFQFDRFYFLYPTLCFIGLAIALSDIFPSKYKILYAIVPLFFITLNLRSDAEFVQTSKNMAGYQAKTLPTYRQFFDEKLFGEICEDLQLTKRQDVKTVVVGMFPAITEYNGFHTLDSYKSDYPLIYKHKFRKIIERELEKSEELKDYFDKWGSRCYIFSSELGRNFLYGKNSEIRELNNLEIDTQALRDLGCSYIISAVKINNAGQLDINYINTYSTPESFWELYVYGI